LDVLVSKLAFILILEKKKAVEFFLKGTDIFVCCQQALEKAWFFSFLFW